MPVQINYLEEGIGVEFVASGIVTGEEIIEANKKLYNPKNLHKLKYKIIDRTNCSEYRVTSDEVETIADQTKQALKTNPDMIIAIVSVTALQYGVSRQWEMLVSGEGVRTAIFEDRPSADAWVKSRLDAHHRGS